MPAFPLIHILGVLSSNGGIGGGGLEKKIAKLKEAGISKAFHPSDVSQLSTKLTGVGWVEYVFCIIVNHAETVGKNFLASPNFELC